MCPGGYVVNASSEPGRLAVNGMSYSSRGSRNANSAIVVTVTPEDYEAKDALDGMRFQRDLEESAYRCASGRIPVETFGDFRSGKENPEQPSGNGVQPQVKGGYAYANVRRILPESLNLALIEGIEAFGHRIPGFDDSEEHCCSVLRAGHPRRYGFYVMLPVRQSSSRAFTRAARGQAMQAELPQLQLTEYGWRKQW